MRNAAGSTTISLDADLTGDAAAMLPTDAISATEIASDAVTASEIATGAVASAEILDATIVNADINAAAAIAATKIGGTAATLNGTQTFTGGQNTFDQDFKLGDSTFFAEGASGFGIVIGTSTASTATELLMVERHYNTASDRYGYFSQIDNVNNGTIYGMGVTAEALTAGVGTGGPAYGGYFFGISDAGTRIGVIGVGQSQDPTIATGTSQGVVGNAYDGLTAYGVYGSCPGSATNEWGGYFSGALHCTGTLTKGAGAFKIDHPLDPENKYLQHSFVESPDMKNIYDGVVILGANGAASVQLPDWFVALNRDFRYQLTAIGAPGPNLYISQEISNNGFAIAGGQSGMKVSWQVTGIR
ncbi:MAG: hypothetical protein ACREBV_10215, partial [Candidatus Zixiibacteriota bacterium]